jgi:hypothetical protein
MVSVTNYADPKRTYASVEYDGTNASDIYTWAGDNNTYSLPARLRVDGTDLYAMFSSIGPDGVGAINMMKSHEAQVQSGDKLLFYVGVGEYDFAGIWDEGAGGAGLVALS